MKFEYRIVNEFLWFPKTINNERKWFCFAIWEEERHLISKFNWFNPLYGRLIVWSDWKPTKFLK